MTSINDATVQKETAKKNPYVCVLSKKRYNAIERMVIEVLEDQQEKSREIMNNIIEIMGYDPNAKTYKNGMSEKMKKYRQEKANSEGISIYKLLGQDKRYQSKKNVDTNNMSQPL